ncbi:MAG TPA: YceI family protein [Candidatus Limnocylindrales bacterium]|nr:YceI family protein [Candidatus Limnocylindrales bacterium]
MNLSGLMKVGAGIGLVALLGAGVAAFVLLHGRVQPLGLAPSISASPRASPLPDDPLALACRRPAVHGNATQGVAGLWAIEPGSVAGYRAHEVFAELASPHEAVARTERISGWVLVTSGDSIQVQAGCIAVDVRTLHSVDEIPGFDTTDRDRSAGEMLGVFAHPFVIFEPYPATMALEAGSTAVQHVRLTGDLEVNGVTRPASFSLDVRLQRDQLAAAGSTVVQAGDFDVQVPQEAGGFVQVDPRITLEVSLVLGRP